MSDPFAQLRERCGRFAGIAGVTVLDGEVAAPDWEARSLLRLLGWCAYRAVGGDGSALPSEASPAA